MVNVIGRAQARLRCRVALLRSTQLSVRLASAEFLESRLLFSGLTYYVNGTTGNDSNPGTSNSAPLKTIEQAVTLAGNDNAVSQSDTIIIDAGIYREQPYITLSDSGASATDRTVITAAPADSGVGYQPVYIDAADPTAGTWIQDGTSNRWYLNNFTTETAGVWVDWSASNDGASLQQIGAYSGDNNRTITGSGVADMVPGSYYGDQADSRLYVWLADGSNPNNHTLEYANRGREIYQPGTLNSSGANGYIYASHIDFIGLNLRHDNPYDMVGQDIGCGMYTVNDERLIDMNIQWNGETGVILRDTSQMIDCDCSNNGGTGVNDQSMGGLITGGNYDANWWRNYTTGGAAGIKFVSNVPTVYGNVTGVEASDNNGYGVWYDTCFENTVVSTVTDNYIHDNLLAGINLEASRNFVISNNIVVNNAGGGITCNAVENADIYNNTFVNNGGIATINLDAGYRDQGTTYPGTTGMIDITIRNNIIANNYSVYDLDVPTDYTGTYVYGNTSDYNLFYRRGETLHFTTGGNYAAWGQTPSTLADWKTDSGQDANSIVADPLFLAGGTGVDAYLLGDDSPARGIGANLAPVVTTDYSGKRRPTTGAFDIGAFQNLALTIGAPGGVLIDNDPTVWWDDQLPLNAAMTQPDSTGNTGPNKFWSWEISNVYSGAMALDSGLYSGAHDQYFTGADPRTIGTNDELYGYVYLNPANPPSEIQFEWQDASGSWAHRAYWGQQLLNDGTDETASQFDVGNLPAAGGWVRLEVPAADVGLAGVTITGFSFDLYNGEALLDKVGNAPINTLPAWLAPGSAATWNSATDILNLTGAAMIIADPGPDEPVIQASESAAVLTVDPATDKQVHLGGIVLSDGASIAVTPSTSINGQANPLVLVIGVAGGAAPLLNIDGSSSLDLSDSDMIVRQGSLSAIDALLSTGYNAANGGHWNGKGILSTAAAAETLTALGAIQDATAGTFDNQSVSSTDVLVKYTYWGDANLDGDVDGSDYSLLDNGYNNHLTGWANGDFNYDGIVDGSDYTLTDNSFNMQGVSLASVVTAPPNPTTTRTITASPNVTAFSPTDDRRRKVEVALSTGGHVYAGLFAEAV